MNRFALGLLASTSLSGLTTAAMADVIYEVTAGFGSSDSTPTLVAIGETTYAGDFEGHEMAWFQIAAQDTPQTVRIQFTASRLTSSAEQVDTPEGGSLPSYLGVPVISGSVISRLKLSPETGLFEGASYPAAYAPKLVLTDPSDTGEDRKTLTVTSPNATYYYEGQAEGVSEIAASSIADSFAIDFVVPAGESLPFSFAYDFDYTLEVTDTADDVPEPAAATLLAGGLLGLAAARRRRRGLV